MYPQSFLPDEGRLALLTDLYQLTMAAGYWSSGQHARQAVFELFVRRLPADRSFLVAAGLEPFLYHVERMTFSAEAVEYLRGLPAFARIDAGFFEYLRAFRFRGDIDAMPEGTVFFANEPVVRVRGGLLEAQVLETIAIACLNIQTLVASKAARVVMAARGRPVVDFGARRAHGPQAALLAARAALIGGCASTSNVLAASMLGVEPVGTMAHSFVMAAEDEARAFETYADCFPEHTTALVDTYNVRRGLERAARLGPRLRAVRLDSGDLAAQAREARAYLDAHGCGHTQIFASGDLNEFEIDKLLSAGAPIDAFGVGTEMVTSRDAPALAMVYKLAAVEHADQGWHGRGLERPCLRPVAKSSEGKATLGGAKQVYRRMEDGRFVGDVLALEDEMGGRDSRRADDLGTPLLAPVVRGGRIVAPPESVADMARRAAEQVAALPPALRALRGSAEPPVTLSDGLRAAQEHATR